MPGSSEVDRDDSIGLAIAESSGSSESNGDECATSSKVEMPGSSEVDREDSIVLEKTESSGSSESNGDECAASSKAESAWFVGS